MLENDNALTPIEYEIQSKGVLLNRNQLEFFQRVFGVFVNRLKKGIYYNEICNDLLVVKSLTTGSIVVENLNRNLMLFQSDGRLSSEKSSSSIIYKDKHLLLSEAKSLNIDLMEAVLEFEKAPFKINRIYFHCSYKWQQGYIAKLCQDEYTILLV